MNAQQSSISRVVVLMSHPLGYGIPYTLWRINCNKRQGETKFFRKALVVDGEKNNFLYLERKQMHMDLINDGIREPESLECDQLQCNHLEYPLHRNELWRFLSLINTYQALLRAFVKHSIQFILQV